VDAAAMEDAVTPSPAWAAAAGAASGAATKRSISPWLLGGIVASMTLLGTALTVLTKLMTIPMQSYPLFLTIETAFAVSAHL